MWASGAAVVAAALAVAGPTYAELSVDGSKSNMDCQIGGLEKQIGGRAWIVYACDDHKSLVFVTAKGNPAMPFYFIVYAKGEDYGIYGEGTGEKRFTSAAFEQLKGMTSTDFRAFVAEAYATSPAGN